MNRRRALHALKAGFHGRLPDADHWLPLIEAANHALVTPSLRQALATGAYADDIPEDAAAFFALVDDRNDARNRKLRALAHDAVEALNAAGILPVYLKGMAVWAACDPAADRYPRMMSDVDLLVPPEDADAAVDALLACGFQLLERHPDDTHVIAELWREGDVGILDLHRRPPGPPGLTVLFDRLAHTQPSPWPGSARLPSPAYQVYLTCLHDMLHDGGFWRGGFDVRHLCDIADLARSPAGIDWHALRALLRTRLARNALFSQLVAARRIVDAPIPADIHRRLAPRVHHRRHLAQYLHPQLEFPLALLGIGLEGPNLRQHWPFLPTPSGPSWANPLQRLRRARAFPNKM